MTEEENRSGQGDAPSTSSGQALRKRAEEIAREKGARIPENMEAPSPEQARQVLHELQVHQIELEMQNEELRGTEVKLETSRARYFDLYDLAPVGYITVSEQGLILEANLTAATLLGVARGALVKRRLSPFILPEDQDIYYRHRKALFETGAPQACEMRLVKEDGALFWARLEAMVAQDAAGAPVCRAVVSDVTERKKAEEALQQARDVLEQRVAERTEELRRANEELRTDIAKRKQAEEALRASGEQHRSILLTAMDGFWLVDMQGRLLEVNEAYCRMSGYSARELLAMGIPDMEASETADAVSAHCRKSMAQGEDRFESRHRRKDGTVFDVEVSVQYRSADGGQFVAFLRDISERKEDQRLLSDYHDRLRSMAMDLALGEEKERRRIAVGLHDQVGQALALACARMDLLAEAAESRGLSGQFGETLDSMRAALEATRTLTFELSPPVLYELGLGPAVAAMARELQQRHGIAFTVEGADECPTGPDNVAVLLYQSIREILINVVKHSKARTCRMVLLSEPHQFVVTVQDNGIGFDADSAFMNKAKQRSFGLFSIRERLRVLGGGMEVASHINHGSLVRMWVPHEHLKSANKEDER
jgi:PAS domain S-box-containing protein